MLDNKKLNPFINLFPDPRDTEKWVLQAPLPGVGLQRLSLSSTEFPRLFELCREIGSQAITSLDFSRELTPEEYSRFVDAGVLIDAAQERSKPLYSCPLDSLSPSRLDGTDIIVDPSMEFEPFDLTKFRTWAGEMSLSPYQPSVWITDQKTGLRSGYWLTQEQAAALAGLEPGREAPAGLNEDLAGRLHTAGILTSAELLAARQKLRADEIDDARQQFVERGYAVIRNVFPHPQIACMQKFYRDLEDQGFMTLGDEFISRRFVAPLEPFASTIHRGLARLMSGIAGRDVKPSYCYASSYLGGSDLPPHRDRPQCEFSFSVQIDYRPMPTDSVSPWPLCLDIDGEVREIYLAAGDCLAYKGCEVTHSRPPLPDAHRSTSLFLHYVPNEWDGELI
jgi:hypothetical protein